MVELMQHLNRLKPFLAKAYQVEKIGLFGSFARGEQTEQSDIDLLVEFSGTIGLRFIELKAFLEQELGRPVDLVTERALKPQLREVVLREVVYQ